MLWFQGTEQISIGGAIFSAFQERFSVSTIQGAANTTYNNLEITPLQIEDGAVYQCQITSDSAFAYIVSLGKYAPGCVPIIILHLCEIVF